MVIDPILFYTLAFITATLTVVLGVIVISYEKTLQKTHKALKENEMLLSHANDKSAHIIEEARKKAFSIIEKANSQAIDSGNALEKYAADLLQLQKGSLEKDSSNLLQDYKEAIQKLREENINVFKNVSNNVEKDAEAQISDFRQIIEKETLESQKIVEQKIEEEYQKLQKELEAYKAEKLQKIDNSIYKILLSVSKQVIGKTISIEDHEQLILDALDKAKKEGIFN